MMRRWLFAAIGAALVLGVAISLFWSSPGQDTKGLEEVSVRLPIPVADAAFSPYYLAIDNGHYRDAGIRVILEPGSPELNPVNMVSQGIDQFGVVGGPELLLSGRQGGANIVGISLLHKDSDFVVVVTLKESEITEIEQLEGKRVGFFYGHISTDILRMFLQKVGVEVEEVDVGFDYGLFISGRLEGQWAFRTTAGINLPARGVELNVISPAASGLKTHGHVIIANSGITKENPGLVRRFLAATLKGLADSVENPDQAIEATIDRDPNFLREVGRAQMDVYIPTIKNNELPGWISQSVIEDSYNQMLEFGLIESGLRIEDVLNDTFVREYYEKN